MTCDSDNQQLYFLKFFLSASSWEISIHSIWWPFCLWKYVIYLEVLFKIPIYLFQLIFGTLSPPLSSERPAFAAGKNL